jgi:hypothetical protein
MSNRPRHRRQWPPAKKTLLLVPEIRDDDPDELKDALAVRNAAATTGTCPSCGCTVVLKPDLEHPGIIHGYFEHEDDCPALQVEVNPLGIARRPSGTEPHSDRTHDEWTAAATEIRLLIGKDPEGLMAEAAKLDPALSDQMEAAVRVAADQQERLERTLLAGPGDFRIMQVSVEVHDQLLGHVLRIIAGVSDGSIDHCPHVGPRSPVPAIAPVFSNWMDCYDCCRTSPRRRVRLSDAEENTCDLCRAYDPDGVHMVTPRFGPLTLLVGLCDTCISSGAPKVTS